MKTQNARMILNTLAGRNDTFMIHLLECKGVVPVMFGSCMDSLLADPRVGNNKDERLEAINGIRENLYTNDPGAHRLPNIYMSNCTRDGWANLAGPAYKAANI